METFLKRDFSKLLGEGASHGIIFMHSHEGTDGDGMARNFLVNRLKRGTRRGGLQGKQALNKRKAAEKICSASTVSLAPCTRVCFA